MFKRAIVRKPAPNFADGLTTAGLGEPDYQLALKQHQSYCKALAERGLSVTVLDMDDRHPDSTFVEDAAVLIGETAVLTRPGASSRAGEVAALRPTLGSAVRHVLEISAPGTLDGGDVCDAEGHYLIGVSQRTNEEGARQLAAIIEQAGFTASLVDIRSRRDILHLKSGIAYLGDKDLVAWEELAELEQLRGYNLFRVGVGERYAANCVRVNDKVLVAEGFPAFRQRLEDAGYDPLVLDVSEFRKMDGGLSCLSIRF